MTPSFSLKSLTLRAFRSVVDEQVIPLPSQGMHLVSGASGAGKTTLGEGIAFALGYSNFSGTDLQSWDWLTKEPLKVVLELETPKGTVRVQRGKGANILLPGEDKPRTSAKGVKEGLAQSLGIDPEKYLAALTYRSQKTPGLFLSMTDADKKSFLTQLLGLDVFERAAEKSVTTASALATELDRAQVKHQTLLSSLPPEPTTPVLQDVAALQVKVSEAELEAAKFSTLMDETKALDYKLTQEQNARVEAVKNEWRPRMQAAKKDFESVPAVDVSEQESALKSIANKKSEYIQKHRGEIALLDKELETNLQVQSGLSAMVSKRTEAEKRLAHAQSARDKIASGTCSTCLREWSDDPTKTTALSRYDVEIAVQKKLIADADEAAVQLAIFAKNIPSLRVRLAELKAVDPVPYDLVVEERRLVGIIASAKSERDAKVAEGKADFHKLMSEAEKAVQIASTMNQETETVRRALCDLQQTLSAANHKVVSAKQTVFSAINENGLTTKYYDQAVEQRTKAVEEVEKAEAAVEAAKGSLGQEKDFLAMTRGFLGYLFDETLARIADSTNARLALIPNVSDLTIKFSSERETQSGKLKQEIVVLCERNGHTIPLKAGLSGGQYTVVELAIDLSLADVIAERSGVLPGWLILDEAFEGLDVPSKVAVFEILKEVSRDRAVLVVDHACELKELFDSRIVVEFDGSRSGYKV